MTDDGEGEQPSFPQTRFERYETARKLAETALEEYARGRQEEGDALAGRAVRIDRSAVEDVVRELEEDVEAAGSGLAGGARFRIRKH
jgi:hypothetical protein